MLFIRKFSTIITCLIDYIEMECFLMSEKLNAQQIIEFIANSKKVTPVKVYVKGENVANLIIW